MLGCFITKYIHCIVLYFCSITTHKHYTCDLYAFQNKWHCDFKCILYLYFTLSELVKGRLESAGRSDVARGPPPENSKLDCMVKTPTEGFFLVKTHMLKFFCVWKSQISRPVGSICSVLIETYRKCFQLLTF